MLPLEQQDAHDVAEIDAAVTAMARGRWEIIVWTPLREALDRLEKKHRKPGKQ